MVTCFVLGRQVSWSANQRAADFASWPAHMKLAGHASLSACRMYARFVSWVAPRRRAAVLASCNTYEKYAVDASGCGPGHAARCASAIVRGPT